MKLYAKATLRHGVKATKIRPGEAFEVDDEAEARDLVERGLATLSLTPGAEALVAGDPEVSDFLPKAVEAFRANAAPIGGLHQVAALLGRALVSGRIDADQHAEAVADIVNAVADGRLADVKAGASRRGGAGKAGGAPADGAAPPVGGDAGDGAPPPPPEG